MMASEADGGGLPRDYTMLPATLPTAAIATYLDEVLAAGRLGAGADSVAEALLELIDRQSYAYAPFTPAQADAIQAWVSVVWPGAAVELIDALCTIIVSVPTAAGRQLLAAASAEDSAAGRLAAEALDEM